jgi:hypothetical protein
LLKIACFSDALPEHQIAMQAPKESKAYKNSINGMGKMVHRYSFTQVPVPIPFIWSVVSKGCKAFLNIQLWHTFINGCFSISVAE